MGANRWTAEEQDVLELLVLKYWEHAYTTLQIATKLAKESCFDVTEPEVRAILTSKNFVVPEIWVSPSQIRW